MPDLKLIEYIKTCLAQGKSKEEIYKELLEQGWAIETIQESFSTLTTEKEKENISKKTINIIVTIGAILIGAGIFLFITANWQEMTKTVKIGIILGSMLLCYSIGWYLKEKLNLEKTGFALFLLGSIIYGTGIFLVAQMFNIRANWPDGFILWMIGAIAMGFAVDFFYLFYLAILLCIIAFFGHVFDPFGIFTKFGYNSFILTSSFLLLVTTIITFIAGRIIRKRMPSEFKEFY